MTHRTTVVSRFSRFARIASQGLEFLIPQRCAMCAAPACAPFPLCSACFAAIPRWKSPLCVRCLMRGLEPVGCKRHHGWDVFAPWIYEDRAASVVHSIKYRGRRRLAHELASELGSALPSEPRFDLIVTVPLHRLRARARGYNQVAPLARGLADIIGVPYVESVLTRTRHTEPQTRLQGEARRRNLQGAFCVHTPAWVAGRRVLILDDVITTGATMAAAMQALREVGSTPVAAALAWAQ